MTTQYVSFLALEAATGKMTDTGWFQRSLLLRHEDRFDLAGSHLRQGETTMLPL